MNRYLKSAILLIVISFTLAVIAMIYGCGGGDSDSDSEQETYAVAYHAVGGHGMVTVALPGGETRTDYFNPWYSFGITDEMLARDPNFTPWMTCDNPKTILLVYQDGNVCDGPKSLCAECE